MVVFESVRAFFEVIMSPFKELFEAFPEYGGIVKGVVVLSLGYFGWRAIK